MSGAFDLSRLSLRGYYDDDCYFNIPMHYLHNISDPWYLDRYRHNTYVLATGVHDISAGTTTNAWRRYSETKVPCRLASGATIAAIPWW